MKTVYIFSYGSNMLFDRIRQRIRSVEVVCTYELNDFALAFNKRSKDNSSKANLVRAEGASVHGVIHRMTPDDKRLLDQYEGLGHGYEMDLFQADIQNEFSTIGFYMVNDPSYLCTDDPYDWYRECVLFGALENELRADHVASIRAIGHKKDQDPERQMYYRKLLSAHRRRFAS